MCISSTLLHNNFYNVKSPTMTDHQSVENYFLCHLMFVSQHFSWRLLHHYLRPTPWTTSSRGDLGRWHKNGEKGGGKRQSEYSGKRRRSRQWRRWWPGGSGVRTCLHLFQRAREWVVTSRVGRHGNLLGLPKRGSIVLPVKTARGPDPTGSPTHMDSRSRIAEEGERRTEGG